MTTGKRFSLGILVATCATIACAQSIRGVGDIQIGMTEANFFATETIRTRTVVEAKELDAMPKDISTVLKTTYELSEQFVDNDSPLKIHARGVSEYFFQMDVGVYSTGKQTFLVKTRFFTDKLFEISIDAPPADRLGEILKQKYGNPAQARQRKAQTCYFVGEKVQPHVGFETIEISTWNRGGGVLAELRSEVLECAGGNRYSSEYLVFEPTTKRKISMIYSKVKSDLAKKRQTEERSRTKF